MKINYKIYVMFLLLFSIYIAGCATKPIPTTTIGAIDGRDRVLIATQESKFKNEVVSRVVEDLKNNDLYIEITDISDLSNRTTEDYKAIVIINDYKLFRFNKHVRNFLDNINDYDKKKIVLLATAGSPNRMNKGAEVDAISSASEIDDADDISMIIVQRVNSILSK